MWAPQGRHRHFMKTLAIEWGPRASAAIRSLPVRPTTPRACVASRRTTRLAVMPLAELPLRRFGTKDELADLALVSLLRCRRIHHRERVRMRRRIVARAFGTFPAGGRMSSNVAPRPHTGSAAAAWRVVSATALVISSMIGTGIFTTTGFLAGDLGSPKWCCGFGWSARCRALSARYAIPSSA